MKDKQQLLIHIQEGLHTGLITEQDLQSLITAPKTTNAQESAITKPDKLSAVDIMFYIAGIVLFAAIMSVAMQFKGESANVVRSILTAGAGIGLWAMAYYLIKSPTKNDIRNGLINAILLTGSLSVIVGGFFITNAIVGTFNDDNAVATVFTFLGLCSIHLLFDRFIRRDLILLMGILLGALAFPTLCFTLLHDSHLSLNVGASIFIGTAGVLAASTRATVKVLPERQSIKSSFDWFATFIALSAMYTATYSNWGALWLVSLIAGILGIFYISIITRNRHQLGTASVFLVITIITVSFKYFSGLGTTTSLILSAMGLLGTAVIASGINKKYFSPSSTATK